MREKAASDSNNSKANGEKSNGGLQEQSLENREDNTNLAFVGDEACREIGTKYETNDRISNKNHVLDINTGDGYFTTEEVDVDEELNNSLEIHDDSFNSVNFPITLDTPNQTTQQNSFISRKMFSNFQNSGKSKSNQNKKSTKSSIFSFKIKKSPKRSGAKGQHNPLSVTDDLAPPSIVISPPTPSPKMSPVSSDNSPPLEQERQVLPRSPVKEVTKKNKKKEPSQERQPNHQISMNNNNNSASISSNKTAKRKEKKKSKSEGKPKQNDELTLNEDTIYHFRDAEDDDPSDVVILAEAVISPAEVHKQPEKSEIDKKEATSKRSVDNENDKTPSKKKGKENKSSNVFKIFNNNRRESDQKIKHSPEAKDNYLMTAKALKDSYINEYSGNKDTACADPEDSSDESPSLNNFRNLRSNPDLAGDTFAVKIPS